MRNAEWAQSGEQAAKWAEFQLWVRDQERTQFSGELMPELLKP
jgi:hypothetical protein